MTRGHEQWPYNIYMIYMIYATFPSCHYWRAQRETSSRSFSSSTPLSVDSLAGTTWVVPVLLGWHRHPGIKTNLQETFEIVRKLILWVLISLKYFSSGFHLPQRLSDRSRSEKLHKARRGPSGRRPHHWYVLWS